MNTEVTGRIPVTVIKTAMFSLACVAYVFSSFVLLRNSGH